MEYPSPVNSLHTPPLHRHNVFKRHSMRVRGLCMLGVSLTTEAAGGRWPGKCSVVPCASQTPENLCGPLPFANISAGPTRFFCPDWCCGQGWQILFLSWVSGVRYNRQCRGLWTEGLGLLWNKGCWRCLPVLPF